MNYIYILVGIILLWSVWGYFVSRVENTPYSVIESKKEYEVRLYPAHIVAQTTVKGTYKEALNQGFRIIAGYIFGGNTKKESIAMTTPVVESVGSIQTAEMKTARELGSESATKAISESIAMTAPVMATIEGESHTIAFGMPKSYTLETLPTPNDSRVEIVTIPERKMAVIRFSWFRTDTRVQSKKQELLDILKKENVAVVGEPQYAGYNGPGTPPWMTRNEVLVEIK
jgi:effector-binding domain-containing protein